MEEGEGRVKCKDLTMNTRNISEVSFISLKISVGFSSDSIISLFVKNSVEWHTLSAAPWLLCGLTPPSSLVCTWGPQRVPHTPLFCFTFLPHPRLLSPRWSFLVFPSPAAALGALLGVAGGVQGWREKLLPHPGVWPLSPSHSPPLDGMLSMMLCLGRARAKRARPVLAELRWAAGRQTSAANHRESAQGERLPGCEEA